MDDNSENVARATRLKLLRKVERSLSILMVSGVKLAEPEQVVRLSQADLNRLELLARKRMAREKKAKDSFEINVVCVRTVIDKGRMRSRAHDVRFSASSDKITVIDPVGIYHSHSADWLQGYLCCTSSR